MWDAVYVGILGGSTRKSIDRCLFVLFYSTAISVLKSPIRALSLSLILPHSLIRFQNASANLETFIYLTITIHISSQSSYNM